MHKIIKKNSKVKIDNKQKSDWENTQIIVCERNCTEALSITERHIKTNVLHHYIMSKSVRLIKKKYNKINYILKIMLLSEKNIAEEKGNSKKARGTEDRLVSNEND